MRTFIIRARQGTTQWQKVRAQVGAKEHFEVIAHSIINAFYVSNDFREDVEVYIVLDGAADFPRTIKLTAAEGLSIAGFHEAAVLDLIEAALKSSSQLQKNQTQTIAPGLHISGFGFEKLLSQLLETRTIYLLEPKGTDIWKTDLAENPVFVLSDHIALPKKNVKSLKHKGIQTISLGKKMLFASQCVVLLNYVLDISA